MLDYGHEWSKIGYIAKELTKFLHPLLKQGYITNVSLKHINFKTSYLKLGFMRQSKLQEKDNGKIQYSKRAKELCEDIYYNLIIMRNVGS